MSTNKEKGFTIIEVALVLAVAALIFLVVFLAVPALQRNQRNDARRRDIAFVVQAVTAYVSSNNRLPGTNPDTNLTISVPTTVDTGFQAHLGDGLSANTETVTVVGTAVDTITPARGTITVVRNARCGAAPGAPIQVGGGTARNAAVVGTIELSRTGNERYCQDV